MRAEDLLAAVNQRRKLLGLPEIAELTADTKVDVGLSAAASGPDFLWSFPAKVPGEIAGLLRVLSGH
jgi:hypothetical protein